MKNNNMNTVILKSLFLCILLFLNGSDVFAHDPDKVFQDTKIIIASQFISVKYVSIFGSILAKVNFIKADKNKDGALSLEERDVFASLFAKDILSKIDLFIDNNKKELIYQEGQLKTLTDGHMQVSLIFVIPIEDLLKGGHVIFLEDNNFLDVSLAEMNFVVLEEGILKILSFEQNSRQFKCEFLYPKSIPEGETVNQVLDIDPIVPEHPVVSEENSLIQILKTDNLSPWLVIIYLFFAMGLGAIHALSPGHGKTIAAAYLVGERGTVRDAVLLGCVVTFSHVGSILVMGLLVLYLSEFVLPQQLYPWFSFISGSIILIVGIVMFRRWDSVKNKILHVHHHGHTHVHNNDNSHDNLNCSVHHHSHVPEGKVRLTSLFMLGISGGMVPCPAALVVFLAAISMQRIAFGLALILAFSLGLAIILMLIGVLVVKSKSIFFNSITQNKLVKFLPLFSACLIILIGISIVINSLVSAGILKLNFG